MGGVTRSSLVPPTESCHPGRMRPPRNVSRPAKPPPPWPTAPEAVGDGEDRSHGSNFRHSDGQRGVGDLQQRPVAGRRTESSCGSPPRRDRRAHHGRCGVREGVASEVEARVAQHDAHKGEEAAPHKVGRVGRQIGEAGRLRRGRRRGGGRLRGQRGWAASLDGACMATHVRCMHACARRAGTSAHLWRGRCGLVRIILLSSRCLGARALLHAQPQRLGHRCRQPVRCGGGREQQPPRSIGGDRGAAAPHPPLFAHLWTVPLAWGAPLQRGAGASPTAEAGRCAATRCASMGRSRCRDRVWGEARGLGRRRQRRA